MAFRRHRCAACPLRLPPAVGQGRATGVAVGRAARRPSRGHLRAPGDANREGMHVNGNAAGDARVAPPGEPLADRRDRLYSRLEMGWATIDRVEAAGGDAGRLIDFWIALLREYERTCDALAVAAAPPGGGSRAA